VAAVGPGVAAAPGGGDGRGPAGRAAFRIKEKLADGLDAIFIGPGGVPELDDMTSLHGVPLPSGQATWDACAGAYGERKIVVGSRPSRLRT
jgi:hypothetical protein